MNKPSAARPTDVAVAKRILIVEDGGIVAIDIAIALQELGFEVTGIAVSSDEAMQKAAEVRPDLVLMDIRIQGELDGIQTAERLQSRFDVPVIYLTAHGDAETLQRAKKTAPLAFLIKPFKKVALQSAVEMALFKQDVEARLRERERWLSSAFGALGDPLISVDRAARIVTMNSAAERLTGIRAAAASGRPVEEILRLMDEAGSPLVESPVHGALDQEQRTVIVEVGIVPSGQDAAVPYRLSITPVNDYGRLLGAMVLLVDLTEQKMLRAARELDVFRALFDEAAIGMIMVDPQSARYVRVNKAFCNITGYTENELLDLTYLDITHPDDRDAALAVARQTAASRAKYSREKRYITKSGEVKWVRSTVGLVSAGSRDLFMGVIEDITERKRAELHARFVADLEPAMGRIQDAGALKKEVLERLARHLGASFAVFVRASAGGSSVTVDEEYRDAAPSLLGGHSRTDYFTPEASEALQAGKDVIIADTAADPRTAQKVEWFRRFDIAASAAVPLMGSQGIMATLTVGSRQPREWRPDEVQLLHEVAARLFPAVERAKAEQALRRSEQLLHKAQSIARLGSWELDLADPELYRNPLRWSDEVFRLFGYEPHEVPVTNELFFRHVPQQEWAVMEAAVQRTLREGVPYDIEHRIVRRDGIERFVHERAELERNAAGRPLRLLGTVQDITEHKEAERAVREADQRKDEFLATLSHELRNPLAPLSNALQIIRRGGPSLGAQALGMAERQLAHMVRLIDDLLDSSRIARGELAIKRERMELADAVIHAVEISRPLIEEKGHFLQIDLPQEPVPVQGDIARLAQVFSNLLNNAARYAAPGGQIQLSLRRDGCDAVVEVIDTGIGIAHDALPRLFDMFSRFARDEAFSAGGLGVGLALVRGITELHGGRVEASSAGLGKGSVFRVRLPVVSARPIEQPATTGAFPSPAVLRVLVVDDNVDAAQSLGILLEVMGHAARVVHDGVAAVQAAAEMEPDIIFMDLGMPGLNGLEATRRIREQQAGKSPVIYALTGWGQEVDRAQSREAGCDGHLVKPPSAEDLERALATVAARSSS